MIALMLCSAPLVAQLPSRLTLVAKHDGACLYRVGGQRVLCLDGSPRDDHSAQPAARMPAAVSAI